MQRRAARTVGLVAVCLMLWGLHGGADILKLLNGAYAGPGSDPSSRATLIAGVPWDHELVSFVFGAIVMLVVPAITITFFFGERLGDYGLALPPPGRRRFAAFATLGLVAALVGPFILGAHAADMRAVYPLYRGHLGGAGFVAYELAYLLFFLALDGVFRGVLLFGIASPEGAWRDRVVPIAVSALAQTVWHLGKPLGEAYGAPVWGVLAAVVALHARSVWPVAVAHWLLNIAIDWTIVR